MVLRRFHWSREQVGSHQALKLWAHQAAGFIKTKDPVKLSKFVKPQAQNPEISEISESRTPPLQASDRQLAIELSNRLLLTWQIQFY